jgi:outer membrane protein TolC
MHPIRAPRTLRTLCTLRTLRFLALLAPGVAGCLAPSWRRDFERLEAEIDARAARARAAPESGSNNPGVGPRPSEDKPAEPTAATEPPPAGVAAAPVDLASLIREALLENPEVRARLAAAEAAIEEVRRASAFEDPVFKAETERVPLRHPGSLNRAEDNLLGISQSFRFPGKRGLEGEAALREAEAARDDHRAAENEVVARIQRAYYEYFMLTKEIEIHREHVGILEDMERIAEARYRTGATGQQDVIKAQVEVVRLHNDIFAIEQALGTARAEINALLDRPPGTPLGPPRELSPTALRLDRAALLEAAIASRPELQALRSRLAAAETGRELARRDAVLPDIALGWDYWHLPDDEDAYGAMVSLNLPWLSGKRAAEARRLGHLARAQAYAFEAGRNQVAFEVEDAVLRLDAARRSAELIRAELLPKAEQSVAVVRSSYEKDTASFLELLDAERSERDIKLAYYQAAARYESARADLERAVGRSLEELQ